MTGDHGASPPTPVGGRDFDAPPWVRLQQSCWSSMGTESQQIRLKPRQVRLKPDPT
jgi:hypothetical protein